MDLRDGPALAHEASCMSCLPERICTGGNSGEGEDSESADLLNKQAMRGSHTDLRKRLLCNISGTRRLLKPGRRSLSFVLFRDGGQEFDDGQGKKNKTKTKHTYNTLSTSPSHFRQI